MENRNKRLEELKQMLLEREYDESVVETAINRAKKNPREKSLQSKSAKRKLKKGLFMFLHMTQGYQTYQTF